MMIAKCAIFLFFFTECKQAVTKSIVDLVDLNRVHENNTELRHDKS